MTTPVIVTIDGHRYDVTDFLITHPGESLSKNRSIKNYTGQDISELFSKIHDSKESRKGARFFLEEARMKAPMKGQSVGIRYLGLKESDS